MPGTTPFCVPLRDTVETTRWQQETRLAAVICLLRFNGPHPPDRSPASAAARCPDASRFLLVHLRSRRDAISSGEEQTVRKGLAARGAAAAGQKGNPLTAVVAENELPLPPDDRKPRTIVTPPPAGDRKFRRAEHGPGL